MERIVREIAVSVSRAILFITLVASCVTTGDSNLTSGALGKIVEGETTKVEIERLLGKSEQIIKLDKESLESYLNRVSAGEPAEISLPEDQYEVWTYSRWNQAAVLVLFPSYEKATACILIMNRDGVCVKKLYTEKSRVRY